MKKLILLIAALVLAACASLNASADQSELSLQPAKMAGCKYFALSLQSGHLMLLRIHPGYAAGYRSAGR